MSHFSEIDIKESGEVVQVAHLSITHKGERMDVVIDDCEFLSVSEDIQGRDLIAIKYDGVEYQGSMKVYRDEELERVIVNDDIEVYVDEAGNPLNMYSRTGADFDTDEIAEEVHDFQSAESELFCFGSIKWSYVDKEWKL